MAPDGKECLRESSYVNTGSFLVRSRGSGIHPSRHCVSFYVPNVDWRRYLSLARGTIQI